MLLWHKAIMSQRSLQLCDIISFTSKGFKSCGLGFISCGLQMLLCSYCKEKPSWLSLWKLLTACYIIQSRWVTVKMDVAAYNTFWMSFSMLWALQMKSHG